MHNSMLISVGTFVTLFQEMLSMFEFDFYRETDMLCGMGSELTIQKHS